MCVALPSVRIARAARGRHPGWGWGADVGTARQAKAVVDGLFCRGVPLTRALTAIAPWYMVVYGMRSTQAIEVA